MHSTLIVLFFVSTVTESSSTSSLSIHAFPLHKSNQIKSISKLPNYKSIDATKYSSHHHHRLKSHPSYLSNVIQLKKQLMATDALVDHSDRSRRSQPAQYHAQLLLFNVTDQSDANGTQLPRSGEDTSLSNDERQKRLAGIQAVHQHIGLFNRYLCHTPKPKLFYPSHFGKRYHPIGTVLHRCDDDTGCCGNAAYTCAAKTQVEVKAYFFVQSGEKSSPSDIEVLTYWNHTECECRELNSRPRQTISGESWSSWSSTVDEKISQNSPLVRNDSLSNTIDSSSDRSDKTAKAKEYEAGTIRAAQCVNSAKCPPPFQIILSRRRPLLCTCDCPEDPADKECILMKKGLKKLPDKSAACINRRKCQNPRCEYPGPYDTIHQLCPRANEFPNATFHPISPNERE